MLFSVALQRKGKFVKIVNKNLRLHYIVFLRKMPLLFKLA